MTDKRQLFEINFWVVERLQSCGRAHAHDRWHDHQRRQRGIRPCLPLLGIYSASKHAVRAYTDTLRMELEHDRIPIRISMVKPGPIDTPFARQAASYMEREPQHAPPVYPPEEVAQAILKCAEKPVREIAVGGAPRLRLAMAALAPRLTDLMMERQAFEVVQSGEQPTSRDMLDQSSGENDGRPRDDDSGRITKSGGYTRAALSDVGRALPFIAIGAAVAVGVAASRR